MTVGEIVGEYLSRYHGTGHTKRARRNDCDHFLTAWAAESVQVLTATEIARWRDARLKLEAPATVARRMDTLRQVLDLAQSLNKGIHNFARSVAMPHVQYDSPEWFTAADAALLRENALLGSNTFKRLRSALVLELGLSQGMRTSEIRALTLSQLDLDGRKISKAWGKGNKFWALPMHSRVAALLEDYLPLRKLQIQKVENGRGFDNERYPVIVSTRGAVAGRPVSFEINQKTILRIVRDIAEAAGISGAYTHRLRHTFIKRVCDAKGLMKAAELGRHSDPRQTMRYAKSSFDELREDIEGI